MRRSKLAQYGLALVLGLFLAACGSDENKGEGTPIPKNEVPQVLKDNTTQKKKSTLTREFHYNLTPSPDLYFSLRNAGKSKFRAQFVSYKDSAMHSSTDWVELSAAFQNDTTTEAPIYYFLEAKMVGTGKGYKLSATLYNMGGMGANEPHTVDVGYFDLSTKTLDLCTGDYASNCMISRGEPDSDEVTLYYKSTAK